MLIGPTEGEKSGTQKAADTAGGTGETGQGILAQAQETLGNAAQSVSDTLGLNQGSSTGSSGSTSCTLIFFLLRTSRMAILTIATESASPVHPRKTYIYTNDWRLIGEISQTVD
jgi:hypothetical protein